MTPPREGTPTTTFRLDPALLAAAKVKATARGETVTDVVRRALREYVEEEHVCIGMRHMHGAPVQCSICGITFTDED